MTDFGDLLKAVGVAGIVFLFVQYWIAKRRDKERSCRKDLSQQRDLLIEFLGEPTSKLRLLLRGGEDIDVVRQSEINDISRLVERIGPHFPKPYREVLGSLSSNANILCVQPRNSAEETRWWECSQQLLTDINKLETYLDHLTSKLSGTDNDLCPST